MDKLSAPPEPADIKTWMKHVHQMMYVGPGVNWEPAVIWAGNRLPKYFWDHWKAELKQRGFTWQMFMRVMRYRTDNILLWYRGSLPWSKLVGTIVELVEGPLGNDLVDRKRQAR
jgi:hypothetical protein